MGKSPAKWFKSVLLRKKSSKSKLSEGNDLLESTNKEEVLDASKVPVSDTATNNSLIPQVAPAIRARSIVNPEHGEDAKVTSDGLPSSCSQADLNTDRNVNSVSQEDADRIRRQTAATIAQTSFRAYQARRAFQTQKSCIIKLQALVRGHFVRRQGLTTLCCVRAIIKLQALARGLRVRHSAVGIEVQNVCNLGKLQGEFAHTTEQKLIKNLFAQKLLASSSQAIPLSLQYQPGDPNSSWEWVERWTRSQFWVSHLQQKNVTKHDTLKKAETKQGRTKRSVRTHSRANAENHSGSSVKEPAKPKRNQRKVDQLVQEHPEMEGEKVNRNLKKTTNPMKEVRERLNVVSGKTKHNVRNSSVVSSPEVPSDTIDVAMTVTRDSDADKSPKLPTTEGSVTELHASCGIDLQSVGMNSEVDIQQASEQLSLTSGNGVSHGLGSQSVCNNSKLDDVQGENKVVNPKDYNSGNENQKVNERRASLPPNVEHLENGVHSTPKLPGYMAPTESARAKLRGQGSPRFSQDAIEDIITTRRHSLPSSTNGRLPSMSPRAQKLVASAGKGLVNSSRSLSSSRDGTVSEKGMKAEWRR